MSVCSVFLSVACAAVPRCIKEGIIVDCIALHTKNDLANLSELWYKNYLSPQPLGESLLTKFILCT